MSHPVTRDTPPSLGQRKYYEASPPRQHDLSPPINLVCLLSELASTARVLSITQRIMSMSDVKQEMCRLTKVST